MARRTHPVSRWLTRGAGAVLAATLLAPLGVAPAGAHTADPIEPPGGEQFRALVFSATAGFRHGNIEAGIAAIEQLGSTHGFAVDHTEDASAFTPGNLGSYDVVVWLSTTGDVLNTEQQAAFEQYIQAGGGYAGIHAASDTEYSWQWYGDLVGAYFSGHPANQDATVVVEDPAHPSTAHLPAQWQRHDEWYSFRENPRGDVHVLASLDESSYDPGSHAMGEDHPIAWCQDYDGGRAWYTAGGHTAEAFAEPAFLEHVLGGLRTAAGVVGSDCTAGLGESYEKVALDEGTQNPMDLAHTPDGRLVYVERDGRVQIIRSGGGTVTAGDLNVTTVQEFGLVGLELDPGFAENGWLYLYYSPSGSPTDRVSRFTLVGDTLDLASEKVLLEIPVQRQQCCHAGGALEFDGQGNLYVATGDNTNPFASGGYTPIDERAGRSAWDAQGTSGNTNSLSGKVLRIHPEADGTYTVPQGNLFAPDTSLTRPEIYAIGFRNPFKIGIDPRTSTLLVADFGPDAGSADPTRGPAATVEWNTLTEPGNYGWPYCVGPNTPYVDHDFATGTSGEPFDCEGGPTNDSPNNTGLTQLPPAIAATIWYQNDGAQGNAPEIGGGGAPMAGGVYVYDEALESERRWPAYWDGKAIFGEWNSSKLFSFQLTDDSSGVLDINRVLAQMSFARPHALEWGTDGALYLIEWGSGFGGNNADSGVYRIDYSSGSRAPIAKIGVDRSSGPVPLGVQFSSEGSRDPDGTEISYAWDFGDGATSTEPSPVHTYTTPGDYTATLTVTDAEGRATSSNQAITAGNTAPTVVVSTPPHGGFFDFGDVVEYAVTVTDPEDGSIDCDDVVVQPALGHDEHAHPYDQYRGCSGAIPVDGDTGHIGADIFGVLTVTYTDRGAPGVSPLTTQEVVLLQPKHKEAEHFAATGRLEGSGSGGDAGVQVEATSDAGGGQNIGFIETDDWFSFDPVNLTGIDSIRIRAASQPGGVLDIRTGSPDGPSVGTVTIPAGGWQTWGDHTLPLPEGATTDTTELFVVATAGQYNINWLEFVGQGVTDNAGPVVDVETTSTTGVAPLTVHLAATATDPDGDTPLSYAWDLGDGATASTAEVTHTYTAAGVYTAVLTVTDARGATARRTVQITVEPQLTQCFAGRSDDFSGAALDTGRWTTVVRANQDLRVEDGHLLIPTSGSDIYGAGEGSTPNIVLQDLPDGEFTATTKVTMTGAEAYQQAGLIIYGDDDNYAKLVLQARSTGGPDANARIFQFIREEGGVPNEVDASNTVNLGAAYPTTVWIRLTSNGTDLVASYSADGVAFTDMPETKLLDGIVDPKIGLLALQGDGRSQTPVEAAFDWFTLTPDPTATPSERDDEFEGSGLDGCRWEVVRPDPAHLRLDAGRLELGTTPGDIYGGSNGAPSNLVLQDLEGDWTVETLVDGSSLDQQYQQAGLIAYVDDDNYVKLDVVASNAPGSTVVRGLELRSEIDGAVQDPQPSTGDVGRGVWHLRLTKVGDVFTGYYSEDGVTWSTLGAVTNAGVAASGRIGLFALGADATDMATAAFEYFHVGAVPVDTTAPVVTATTDPSVPSGAGGWYTGAVHVSATATDDSPGDVAIERRIDGGEWSPYTGALLLDVDGRRTVELRAVDAAQNVSEVVVVDVAIDSTAPEVALDGVEGGDVLGAGSQLVIDATGIDTGSGLADVVMTVDGQPVESGASLSPSVGRHDVVITARDVAGNTSEVIVSFEASAPPPTVAEVRDGLRLMQEQGRIPTAQWRKIDGHLASAQRFLDQGKPSRGGAALEKAITAARGIADATVRGQAVALLEGVRDVFTG